MGMNDTPSGERVRIGFFGQRNAGKSSVVNAFTSQNLSIVSDVKGTTTDPVFKSMELLPMGPVMIIDTPGLDDEGELGKLRMEKCRVVMRSIDVALLVVDGSIGFSKNDEDLYFDLQKRQIPTIVVINKVDLLDVSTYKPSLSPALSISEDSISIVSAKTGEGINALREKTAHFAKGGLQEAVNLLPSFVKEGDTVVLVVPVDSAAPKGRLILPQQQTIRACLDNAISAFVCREKELKDTLGKLKDKPNLVITDSQAFNYVSKIVPEDVPLTGFSILFAKYKGDLEWQLEGASKLDKLKDNDKVLIAEGCTHHRQCDDIGTVKMPNWIKNYTQKELIFETCSGAEFPSTQKLTDYALVVHCGGCMLNAKEMKYRVNVCRDCGIPITNYGIAIAKMNGILDRAIAPVTED